MCIAVPAEVTWVGEGSVTSRPAEAQMGGRSVEVDLVMVPEAGVGDHVVVHSGYALRLVPPEEARLAQELLADG